MRRVAITGAGTVNALAHDVAGTWDAFRTGRGGIGRLDVRDLDRLTVQIGGQVKGWDEAAFGRDLTLLDRFTQFTLTAAREAVAQAGVDFGDGARAGAIMGTAAGGLGTIDDNYRAVYAEGKNRVHPLTVPRLMASAGASHVSMAYGLKGPVFSVASACASSNHAMGLAFQMIRGGMADVMLTGGADAMLCFGGIKAWEGLRVMSPDGCRPFCATRNGMVMGEGAGVFVFEEMDRARARGADILAEVAGFGMTSDAADIVLPSAEGAARAVRAALADAGLRADQVGYINAHGTGTAANDRTEAGVIAEVFGGQVPVSSTKAAHGHLIGGTGAVELLACILALREGVVAPTLGHRVADAGCAIDLVTGDARQVAVQAAVSNAFAFGGLNAVIALKRA